MIPSRTPALLRERRQIAEEIAASLDTQRRAATLSGEERAAQLAALWRDEFQQPYPKAERRKIAQRWLAAAREIEQVVQSQVSAGMAPQTALLQARRARLEAELALESLR